MSKAMGQTATPADHLLGDFASLENMGGSSLSKEEKNAMNKEIGKFAFSVMSSISKGNIDPQRISDARRILSSLSRSGFGMADQFLKVMDKKLEKAGWKKEKKQIPRRREPKQNQREEDIMKERQKTRPPMLIGRGGR